MKVHFMGHDNKVPEKEWNWNETEHTHDGVYTGDDGLTWFTYFDYARRLPGKG